MSDKYHNVPFGRGKTPERSRLADAAVQSARYACLATTEAGFANLAYLHEAQNRQEHVMANHALNRENVLQQVSEITVPAVEPVSAPVIELTRRQIAEQAVEAAYNDAAA
jgi:hypothetical protein